MEVVESVCVDAGSARYAMAPTLEVNAKPK